MVFFTCDACGESLKKNQVEKHYSFKCRRCSVLTCVDCQKDFPGESYKEHIKCITEDEKYGGKNYQPKASANKGLKKQNAWIENLQDLVKAKSGELDGDVKSVVSTIINYDNVPRKKAKFINFAKNVLGGGRRSSPQTLDKTWELLEQALKKPEQPAKEKNDEEKSSDDKNVDEAQGKVNQERDEEPTKSDKKKKKRKVEKEGKENGQANGSSETEENVNKENEEKPTKSDKKKKQKAEKEGKENGQANGVSEVDAVDDKEEPEEEEVNRGVKKFKGSGSIATTGDESAKSSKKKKRKAEQQESAQNGDSETPCEKKIKVENQEESSGSSKPKAKFDWEESALSVLQSSSKANKPMKLKRLKRKVMIRYFDHIGSDQQLSDEEKQKLESKLVKKVNKSSQFKVDDENVSLSAGASTESPQKEAKKDTAKDKELKDEVAKVLSGLKDDMENGTLEVEPGLNGNVGQAQSFNQWESANLGDDSANAKFRRLMGLGKNSAGAKPASNNSWQGFKHQSTVADKSEVNRMFSQQEEQFQRAVGAKRGMGFGFAEEQSKPKNKKITFD